MFPTCYEFLKSYYDAYNNKEINLRKFTYYFLFGGKILQQVVYCPYCRTTNPPGSLFCQKCGQPLLYKRCPNCGAQVYATYQQCPNCRYTFSRRSLAVYRKTISQSSYYIPPRFKPTNSLIDNIRLIYNFAFKKRPPLYNPSPAVYQRLPYQTILRSSKYLYYALACFIAGIILAFIVTTRHGLLPLFLPSFIAAIIPILIYIYWMKRVDRYEPEPLWLLALAFGWGAASTLPAVILNDLLIPILGGWTGGAAFVEEPCKILGVYLIATSPWLMNEFNDHLDGLLYGAVAGLGFGFVENIIYISRFLAIGKTSIIIVRAITVSMHMFCTGLIGWWMGYLKVNNMSINISNILPALVFAILIHMTWNTVSYLGILGMLIIFVAGPFLVFKAHKMAVEALTDEYYWGFAQGYAPVEK